MLRWTVIFLVIAIVAAISVLAYRFGAALLLNLILYFPGTVCTFSYCRRFQKSGLSNQIIFPSTGAGNCTFFALALFIIIKKPGNCRAIGV
jgi:uncharacterized membrane protein YtjA (UPF0391 family)